MRKLLLASAAMLGATAGVASAQTPVPAASDDRAVAGHDHRADRDLALSGGFFRKRKGFFHPPRLMFHRSKITTAGSLPAAGLFPEVWCTHEDSNLEPSDP